MNSEKIVVDDQNFLHLHKRPSLLAYVKAVWGRRHFIYADARGKSFETNRDYYLGKFWLIASPLLDSAMYGAVFGLLLRTSRGVENFIGYLIIGVIFFSFLTKYVNSGTLLIRSSKNMITAFQFPRASLVFSQAVRNVFDSIPPALVALTAAVLAQLGEPLHLTILWIIPIFILLHVFGTGLMFIAARICFEIPDVQALVRVGLRAWFYVSGVFFSIERFATQPIVQDVMSANPAYQFLTAIRGAALYGSAPTLGTLFILASISCGTFIIGLIYFWRAEEKYGSVQ